MTVNAGRVASLLLMIAALLAGSGGQQVPFQLIPPNPGRRHLTFRPQKWSRNDGQNEVGTAQTRKSIDLPSDHRMGELKPGPGVEKARANCVACHSTDYIVRQPGSDEKRWEQEVRKMIEVFGAPISEPDAREIVQYLATVYGPTPAVPHSQSRGAPARPVPSSSRR